MQKSVRLIILSIISTVVGYLQVMFSFFSEYTLPMRVAFWAFTIITFSLTYEIIQTSDKENDKTLINIARCINWVYVSLAVIIVGAHIIIQLTQ